MTHDAAARCADSHADGNLALASRRAGQQQVSDIGAGDKEHQADHRHQRKERRAIPAACIREAGRGGAQRERTLKILLLAVGVPICGERGTVDLRRQRLHLGFRLLWSLTRRETAQNAQPPPASRGQCAAVGVQDRFASDGDGHIVRCIHIQALEPGRRHADDGERVPVQPDGLANDIGVASEMVFPETVADDRDRSRMPAAMHIVSGREDAPAHGGHAEDVKEIAADPQAFREMAFAARGQIETIPAEGQGSRESLLVIAQLFPDRVGEIVATSRRV